MKHLLGKRGRGSHGFHGHGHGLHVRAVHFFLGFQDRDHVVEVALRAQATSGVMGQHDGHLDAQHTLAHQHVADGGVDVLLVGVTSLDHESFLELHGLGTLRAQLTRHDHFATLGTGFEHEAQHTHGGAAHGEAAQKLVLEGFGLSLRTQTAVGHAFGVEFHGAVGKVETLLHDRRQFADALALFAEHFLRLGGADDDFGAERGHAHFDAGIPIFSQLALQQLVEFGEEDTVGDELSLLGNVKGHL
ncbi:hypothetical protein H257_02818 [Aphanomyces astaci]|uniref:Uncharacterized protein n=1 Tax=Aphanomyces astaci TaxID=112090 RepID=W4H017_APHAT|nr:hypothetical protein H257_02818 [Aphanomyces astaci]ETV84921.1 hypothetical protein H257_02818 [Aphanomyces astaci]|eukprot:XP_009824939.1 hypothetical protein H257_02818 [Aphanomyces astaci]